MSQRNTTHAQRVNIVEEHLAGKPLTIIAEKMAINYYTARKWWRKYTRQGWSGLIPKSPGPSPSGPLSRFDPLVKYVALRLKCEHPAWGLDVLLLHLGRRRSLKGKPLPGRTALDNYLRPYLPRFRPQRRLPMKRPDALVSAVSDVHQRWQIDFKGRETIAPEGQVAPFLVCDEFSSAPLAGVIYTKRTGDPKAGLSYRDIQQNLRMLFGRWGMPEQLRMDRDALWVGSTRLEWPGTLLLLLVGLGIQPVINRPRHPTDNAQVERLCRTWNDHVGQGIGLRTKDDLQAQTDQAWSDRRGHLPSRNPHCAGKPPLVALPHLAWPKRIFAPELEASLFDMKRVFEYLSQWEWKRKVDQTGAVSMADYNRLVSKKHVGQIVKVRFDKDTQMFSAFDVKGTFLHAFTLPIISEEFILGQGYRSDEQV